MNLMIRKLMSEDAPDAGRVVGASMMVEPGYVSVLPDEALRTRILGRLVTDAARDAISYGTAFGAFDGDRLVGASLWLPPGVYPPPPLPEGIGDSHLPPYLRELDDDVLTGLITYDENCVRHFPDEPAWYLMYLGVDPTLQGGGIGSALLRESLDQVMQEAHLPVYLETGTAQNVRFYERFGFEIREAEVQLAPGLARHWTMLRPARTPVATG
jgi:ribosomal protein S18 acetylase RimI-like enzyme